MQDQAAGRDRTPGAAAGPGDVVELLAPGVCVAHPRHGLGRVTATTDGEIVIRFGRAPVRVAPEEFLAAGLEVLGHPTHGTR